MIYCIEECSIIKEKRFGESIMKDFDLNSVIFDREQVVIDSLREGILNEFKRRSISFVNEDMITISPVDLKIIFNLYNEKFFFGLFTDLNIKFSISPRMTSAGGKTIAKLKRGKVINDFEIRISSVFFKNYRTLGEERSVCGINCADIAMGLFVIMEHEMIHLLEFKFFGASSCAKERFKAIAYNMFKHTQSYHSMPNSREVLRKEKEITLGDRVGFVNKGERLSGILYKINKRAVVMVSSENGDYKDKHGNRYEKYYVPLDRLDKHK